MGQRRRATTKPVGRAGGCPPAAMILRAATLLLLLSPSALAPSLSPASDADLPDCDSSNSGGTMVTDKIPVQRMHPPTAAPPGSVYRPYAQLPSDGTVLQLDALSFTYSSQLATLASPGAEPWIVDFYAHNPHVADANTPRVSEQDETAFFTAAAVLRGICSFAVCELSTVVQLHPRAFPGYPCVSLLTGANNFMGRMIASHWKGNRTLLGLVLFLLISFSIDAHVSLTFPFAFLSFPPPGRELPGKHRRWWFPRASTARGRSIGSCEEDAASAAAATAAASHGDSRGLTANEKTG